MAARGRLFVEIKEASRNLDPAVKLIVNENNMFQWTGDIAGPSGSPYEGGRFVLDMKCPANFPISPPVVNFKTPIFHPNVNFQTGELCMDVLKSTWSPAWTLSFLCYAIISLLSDPNPDSPLNCDAGNLLRSGDTRGFASMARMYTKEFATLASQQTQP